MIGGTLFSGIGAPELAAPWIDWRWCAETEPFASAVLAHHFGTPNLGDVTEVDWDAVEPMDLIVAGPPCQDHSVAGRRAGLEGKRGNLSLVYVDILDAVDPLWSVTENVPGWLSLADNAFGTFLGRLVGADSPLVPGKGQRWTDAGVVDGPRRTAAWRTLDAQFFGVPQRRRRVFVIAVRGSGNRAAAEALFPFAAGMQRHPPSRREAREGVAVPITPGSPRGSGYRNDCDRADNLIAADLRNGTIDEVAMSLQGGGMGEDRGGCPNAIPHLIAGHFEQNSMGGRGTLGWNQGDQPLRPVKPQGDHQMLVVPPLMARSSRGSTQGLSTGYTTDGHIVTHSLRADGLDASEDGSGHGTPLIPVQCNGSNVGTDLPSLRASNQHITGGGPAIAFDARQSDVCLYGDRAGVLDSDGHTQAIAFDIYNQQAEATAHTLRVATDNGLQSTPHVYRTGMSVRRLTPRECERLQGFPDQFTAIPYRGKPAADGPRYRALGNAMAIPVIGWVLRRIREFELG